MQTIAQAPGCCTYQAEHRDAVELFDAADRVWERVAQVFLTYCWLEPQSDAGDGDDLLLDPSEPPWCRQEQIASEVIC